jgi:hypothetical protein
VSQHRTNIIMRWRFQTFLFRCVLTSTYRSDSDILWCTMVVGCVTLMPKFSVTKLYKHCAPLMW